MSQTTIKVLLVSDDDATRSTVSGALATPFREQQFQVEQAGSAAAGRELIKWERPDCVIVDHALSDGTCRDVIATRDEGSETETTFIVIGVPDDNAGHQLLAAGAHEYLTRDEMAARLIVRTVCIAVEKRQLSSRVIELATQDDLTKTYTRRHLLERLPQMTALSIRHKYALTACLIDLDGLTRINRQYGTQAGDRVIVHLAQVIIRTVRKEDLVARFGGDMFCAVFSHCTQDQGVGIIQRVRDNFDSHQFYAGLDGQFTARISCGLAEFLPWESVQDWLIRTEGALRTAKTNSVMGLSLAEHSLSPTSEI